MVLGRELLALRQDLALRLLSASPLLPLFLPADVLMHGWWAFLGPDHECIFLLELQHIWENTPEGSGYWGF